MSSSGEEVADMDAFGDSTKDGQQVHWTKELILRLIDEVDNHLPRGSHNLPFDHVDIDWDVVGEQLDLSADICETKWLSLIKCVRTFRTLPEMISDLETQHAVINIKKLNTVVKKLSGSKPRNNRRSHSNSVKSERLSPSSSKTPSSHENQKKIKGNPDHPKKPAANGYSLYCQTTIKDLKDYKGMNKFVKISQMWKALSDNEKEKYNHDAILKKENYINEVQKYAEEHPDDLQIRDLLSELESRRNSKKRVRATPKKMNVSMTPANGLDTPSHAETDDDDEDDDERLLMKTPTKKLKFSPKKKSKPVRTGESVYIETKIENYREEHPERDQDYLLEKLKRKYAKLSDQKKAKWEARAKDVEL